MVYRIPLKFLQFLLKPKMVRASEWRMQLVIAAYF